MTDDTVTSLADRRRRERERETDDAYREGLAAARAALAPKEEQ